MRQSLRRLSQSRPSLPHHHHSSPPFLPSFALVPLLLLPDSVVVDHFRLASPVSCGADSDRFSSRVFAALGPCVRWEGGWRCEVCEVFARERGGAGGDGAHQKISLRRERSWPPHPLSSASPLGPARPGFRYSREPVLRVREYLFRPLPLTHLAFSSSIPSAARPSYSLPVPKRSSKKEKFRNTTTRDPCHEKSAVILSGHTVQVQTFESIRERDTFFSIWPL